MIDLAVLVAVVFAFALVSQLEMVSIGPEPMQKSGPVVPSLPVEIIQVRVSRNRLEIRSIARDRLAVPRAKRVRASSRRPRARLPPFAR